MSRTFTITLGETDYTISQLPTGPADKWRKLMETVLLPIVQTAATAGEVDISSLAETSAFVQAVSTVFINSPATIRGLLFEYAPVLEQNKVTILETAYDDEIFAGFVEVLRRVYPFGTILSRISEIGLGR
ncbi:MAG TPA: hypothetical protein VGD99_11280 [Anaerolineae bacterium]